jgi:hypothetical protein
MSTPSWPISARSLTLSRMSWISGRSWKAGMARVASRRESPYNLSRCCASSVSLPNDREENGVRIGGHFRGGKVEEINFRLGSEHVGCVSSRHGSSTLSEDQGLTVECRIPEVVPQKT